MLTVRKVGRRREIGGNLAHNEKGDRRGYTHNQRGTDYAVPLFGKRPTDLVVGSWWYAGGMCEKDGTGSSKSTLIVSSVVHEVIARVRDVANP